jgi:hypothetical protein
LIILPKLFGWKETTSYPFQYERKIGLALPLMDASKKYVFYKFQIIFFTNILDI